MANQYLNNEACMNRPQEVLDRLYALGEAR